MSFREMVAKDNVGVFMNQDEFAEQHTVIYDGVTYTDISCVISQLKEQDRSSSAVRDHSQGLYLVTSIFHCPMEALGGHVPEKGTKIKISDGDNGFMREFYVAQSGCDLGMIRLELEAIDE